MSNISRQFHLETLANLYKNYTKISGFTKKYNNQDYMTFDYSIVHHLSIFVLEPNIDFAKLTDKIEKIIGSLGAINHIFAKPILHLKEQSVIMPIEAVRIIDKDSIQNLAAHSELWDDIYKDSIKPAKLLTRIYQDNYAIYENLIFCQTIDNILMFTRSNIRQLKELVLTKQILEFNLLERVNHLNYFMALGKLHTGYIRFFDRFYDVAQNSIVGLKHIEETIIPKLKFPVYRKNKKRPRLLQLRKTNILTMHKSYRQIFSLMKYLKKRELEKKINFGHKKLTILQENYFDYCQILILFAVGHFNFIFNDQQKIDFTNLHVTARFKKWSVTIKSFPFQHLIQIDMKKNRNYRFILSLEKFNLNSEKEEFDFSSIKKDFSADEYLLITPYEKEEYLDYERYVSISNIESFRRIQQLILKAMIYSDAKRNDCPFCQADLAVHKEETKQISYICRNCRTIISDCHCPKTEEKFSFTTIYNLESKVNIMDETHNDWLYNSRLENQMFFRNITKLTNMMEIICPCCQEIHKF